MFRRRMYRPAWSVIAETGLSGLEDEWPVGLDEATVEEASVDGRDRVTCLDLEDRVVGAPGGGRREGGAQVLADECGNDQQAQEPGCPRPSRRPRGSDEGARAVRAATTTTTARIPAKRMNFRSRGSPSLAPLGSLPGGGCLTVRGVHDGRWRPSYAPGSWAAPDRAGSGRRGSSSRTLPGVGSSWRMTAAASRPPRARPAVSAGFATAARRRPAPGHGPRAGLRDP
jgi:hypothetical protein